MRNGSIVHADEKKMTRDSSRRRWGSRGFVHTKISFKFYNYERHFKMCTETQSKLDPGQQNRGEGKNSPGA